MESNCFVFEIDFLGFKGTFVGHRPTLNDLNKIKVNKIKILHDLTNLDEQTKIICHIVATLEVIIDESPPWWNIDEITDLRIVEKVYEKYVEKLQSFKASLNLKEIAKNSISTLDYWFRNKYNLSPKDPRYLNCESWELELEFEIEEARRELSENPLRNICSDCGKIFFGNECPHCGKKAKVEKYFDPDFNKYFDEVEEENEEFFATPQKWEEVK